MPLLDTPDNLLVLPRGGLWTRNDASDVWILAVTLAGVLSGPPVLRLQAARRFLLLLFLLGALTRPLVLSGP